MSQNFGWGVTPELEGNFGGVDVATRRWPVYQLADSLDVGLDVGLAAAEPVDGKRARLLLHFFSVAAVVNAAGRVSLFPYLEEHYCKIGVRGPLKLPKARRPSLPGGTCPLIESPGQLGLLPTRERMHKKIIGDLSLVAAEVRHDRLIELQHPGGGERLVDLLWIKGDG